MKKNKHHTKEVYAVWTNTDLTEGRGQEFILFLCKIEATARRLAEGNYVMGTNCRITKETIKYDDARNMWYYPGARVVEPTKQDIYDEELLEMQRVAKERKDKALTRAKELGLSDEEIEALKG